MARREDAVVGGDPDVAPRVGEAGDERLAVELELLKREPSTGRDQLARIDLVAEVLRDQAVESRVEGRRLRLGDVLNPCLAGASRLRTMLRAMASACSSEVA